jgi:hypothetical protein
MDSYGDLMGPRSRLLNLADRKGIGTAGLKAEKRSHGNSGSGCEGASIRTTNKEGDRS